MRQTGNSDGRQDEKRRTEETLICLTALFPKRKRDERKEATYKSAGSEGMLCSREEGQPPGDGSTLVAPEANLIKAKMFGSIAPRAFPYK